MQLVQQERMTLYQAVYLATAESGLPQHTSVRRPRCTHPLAAARTSTGPQGIEVDEAVRTQNDSLSI
jgi:hypothetical protein